MPKKTRKMKQRAAERRSMQQGGAQENVAQAANPSAGESAMRMRADLSASRAGSPLVYDYTHIYNDLKRIALFAGFFFAVLIVLSFIIK